MIINNVTCTNDQEATGDHVMKRQKLTSSSSNPNNMIMSSSSYYNSGGSLFHNPRIVKVSSQVGGFGGKDRHSKVLTVKGVRDRRIRLSIPTAIHLYHLQHQLGLTQPSKVIDWLLRVTQQDIDKLPPLQMSPQNFKNVPHSFNSFSPPFFNNNITTNTYHHHQKMEMERKGVFIENKWNNSYSYNQDSDQKTDTYYASMFPSSTIEPQIFSCFPSTPSFPPPNYVMPLQLLSSASDDLPLGLNVNSVVKSQRNGNG